MELALLIWLIGMLNPLNYITGIVLFVTLIVSSIAFLSYKIDGADTLSMAKVNAIVCSVACFLFIVVPSERTSYLMVGAYAAQKIVTDPRTEQVGGKVLQIINNKLDSYLPTKPKESTQ